VSLIKIFKTLISQFIAFEIKECFFFAKKRNLELADQILLNVTYAIDYCLENNNSLK
jgi:hypothetical protein